jgi:hypothetical protein
MVIEDNVIIITIIEIPIVGEKFVEEMMTIMSLILSEI